MRPIHLNTLETAPYGVWNTSKTFTLLLHLRSFLTGSKFVVHWDNFFLIYFFPQQFLPSISTKHLGLSVVKVGFVLCTCGLCTQLQHCRRHISEQSLRYCVLWVSWEQTQNKAGKNYSVMSSVKYFNTVFKDPTKHSQSKLSRWHYPSLLTSCPETLNGDIARVRFPASVKLQWLKISACQQNKNKQHSTKEGLNIPVFRTPLYKETYYL